MRESAVPGNASISFEHFDEWMRLDLDALAPIKVDFGAIPYGYDNKERGLYNSYDGRLFYVGQQSWFAGGGTRWGFLTTETLMARLVETIHFRVGRQLFPVSIPKVPGVHPVAIPTILDPRASKRYVPVLACEILDSNPDAVVITDHVKDMDRVLTHQSAKGRNGLEDNDVYIILTDLAPARYALLNVLGQSLAMPDIINVHFEDLINQAVGRN